MTPIASTAVSAAATVPLTGQLHFLPMRAGAIRSRGNARVHNLQAWIDTPEIDLADPQCLIMLRELDAVWPTLGVATQRSCLHDKTIVLPAVLPDRSDIALLPGGIVALRSPDGMRVAEPQSAVTLTAAQARRLREVLHSRKDTATLTNTEDGVVCQARMPATLPPQSVTIVAEGRRLPGNAAMPGPVLVQWYAGGAVAWSLAAAPALIALAASVAGVPLAEGATPASALEWQAHDTIARCDMLVPGVSELAADLLAGEVSDVLRDVIISQCIAGSGNLVSRMADALAAVPASFQADADVQPGAPPVSWQGSVAFLRSVEDAALIGLEGIADAVRVLAALREMFPEPEASLFLETGGEQHCPAVALDSEAANYLVRRAGPRGRIGVMIPCPTAVVDLYGIASGLVGSTGVPVMVAAPCWGFRHHVTPNWTEAGNAAWFGLGVGLDELDVLGGAD